MLEKSVKRKRSSSCDEEYIISKSSRQSPPAQQMSSSERIKNILELLEELEGEEEAERAGYAACAQETLKFLCSRGFSADDALLKKLRDTFIKSLKELGMP